VAQHARTAWRKAERSLDAAVPTEGVVSRGAMARAVLRPAGPRNDRAGAPAQGQEAAKPLTGPEGGKGRRGRRDARTLYDRDGLQASWAEAGADPLWREGCARLGALRETRRYTPGAKRGRLAQLAALEQAMGPRLWPEWPSAYARGQEKLSPVVRARRAVACINRMRRRHPVRHRQVSQGMLDLKRLYWHGCPFRHGQRKRACPEAFLGLKLPTYRWWTLLQLDPKEGEQKLSTHRVAA
jgi:hypothetical protein